MSDCALCQADANGYCERCELAKCDNCDCGCGEAAPAPQAPTQDAAIEEADEWLVDNGYLDPSGTALTIPDPDNDGVIKTNVPFARILCEFMEFKRLAKAVESQAEAPRPSAPNDKLLALVKASVHLAILRHDLGDDDMDIDAILEDTANAVRGIDTCAEEPIQEWTALAESRPSAEEVKKLLIEEGWHISDGVDSCSGHDEDEMRKSAKKIVEMLVPSVTESLPSSAEEAKEWVDNNIDDCESMTTFKHGTVYMPMMKDGKWVDSSLAEILAEWMQERITRP